MSKVPLYRTRRASKLRRRTVRLCRSRLSSRVLIRGIFFDEFGSLLHSSWMEVDKALIEINQGRQPVY